jgi:two-component system, NtrC family, response regulator HydG
MAGAEIRILIVEDDQAHAEALEMALAAEGYLVEIADGTDSALDRLRARDFDLVLTDLVLGERDGLELLREARRMLPDLSVFLITGHGSIETAVQAMREGAADYLTKPVNLAELRTRVVRELEKRELAADNQALRAELDSRFGMEGIVGNSPPIQQVFDLVRQVGPTDATVLLLGESGTGKELVARACHRLSRRSKRRFVAINCAAMTDTLIESELFGHTKGAFTGANNAQEGKFQYAHGGTLFLDEIGDMPLATQAKLLRVLEEAEVTPVGSNTPIPVDVRIVAATNQDLLQRVEQGRFRQDLYYRLAVVSIDLPPLRTRPDDLALLADHFRANFASKHGKEIRLVQDQVIQKFRSYGWPGNVRELRNAIETMVVLDSDGELGSDDLPVSFRVEAKPMEGRPLANAVAADPMSIHTAPTTPVRVAAPNSTPTPEAGYQLAGKSLEAVERDLIEATLKSVRGNRQKAAVQLGMGERTLYRKIKEYDLN